MSCPHNRDDTLHEGGEGSIICQREASQLADRLQAQDSYRDAEAIANEQRRRVGIYGQEGFIAPEIMDSSADLDTVIRARSGRR